MMSLVEATSMSRRTRLAPCCIGPENFRGAMIIDAPSMFPLFGKPIDARCKKKAPGRAGASKELTISRDQGALDAPILSQRTNQARRGSRKRPDPPRG